MSEPEATIPALLKRKEKLRLQQQELTQKLAAAAAEIVEAATLERDAAEADLRAIADDPPITSDGKCYLCGRKRTEVAVEHDDPFCSTDCCKTWHSRVARRLGLFPQPRQLVKRNDTLLILT